MAPRETENNAYAKFWADKQRAIWYVMVFSGVVNCIDPQHGRLVTWLQNKNRPKRRCTCGSGNMK